MTRADALIRHLEGRVGLNLAGVEWALGLLGQLMEMHNRVSTVQETNRLQQTFHQEMERLFQTLDLPVERRGPDTPEVQS